MTKSHLLTAALAFALGMAAMFAINEFGNSSNVVSDSGEVKAAVAKDAWRPASRIVVRDSELEEVLTDAGFHWAFAFKYSGGLLVATLHPKDVGSWELPPIIHNPSTDLPQDLDSPKVRGHLLVLIDKNGTAQICSRIRLDERGFRMSRSPKVETALIWNDYPDGKGGPQPAIEVSHFSEEDFEREEPPGLSLFGGPEVFTLKWAD